MDTTKAKTDWQRNGERELPTEPGYYWFKGLYAEGGALVGNLDGAMLRVSFPGGLGFVNHGANGFYLAQFQGRFWGPVAPPWLPDRMDGVTNGHK